MVESYKYEISKEDGKKILLGAGIAIGGALLTYATEVIPSIDWGVWTPAVVAGASILINAARKWLSGR